MIKLEIGKPVYEIVRGHYVRLTQEIRPEDSDALVYEIGIAISETTFEATNRQMTFPSKKVIENPDDFS